MTAPASSSRQVPNTLRVPCLADELRVIRTESALAERVSAAERLGVPVTVLGGGSNVVLRSRLPGLTLLLRLRGVFFERLDGQAWRVTASAGEVWNDLVRATLGRGVAGLENLALIPGSVGAAPMQNIGAYGRELAQVLESVTAFDRQRCAFVTLPAGQCGLRYRDSRFRRAPGRFVMTRVALRLGETPVATGYSDVTRELERMGLAGATPSRPAVAEAVGRVRRRKLPDPRWVGNVGSFFKNPVLTARQLDGLRAHIAVDAFPAPPEAPTLNNTTNAACATNAPNTTFKIPAARLIDAAGWKGVQRGPMQVWPRQPLVLVNRGGATGEDALSLAREIRDDVRAKYGVRLELEPRVAGVSTP